MSVEKGWDDVWIAVKCVDIWRNTSGEGDDLAHN